MKNDREFLSEFMRLWYNDYVPNHLNDMNMEKGIDYILNKMEEYHWTEDKVFDFVNWYLDLHKLPFRYKLENQTIVDSFKRGDDYKVWHENEKVKVGDKLKCLENVDNIFGWPLFVEGEIYEVLCVEETDITLNHRLYANECMALSIDIVNKNFEKI